MAISCTPSLPCHPHNACIHACMHARTRTCRVFHNACFKGPVFQCFLTVMRVSSLLTDSQILAQLLSKCAQNTNKATRFFFMFFVFFGYIINHTRLLRWSSGWKVFHTVKAPTPHISSSRKSIVIAPEKVLKNLHKHETDGCCCCHTGNQKKTKHNPSGVVKNRGSIEHWRLETQCPPTAFARSSFCCCSLLLSLLHPAAAPFSPMPFLLLFLSFYTFFKIFTWVLTKQNKQNKILLDGLEQRKYLGPIADEGFCWADVLFLHVSPPVLGVFSFVHKVMNGFHW